MDYSKRLVEICIENIKQIEEESNDNNFLGYTATDSELDPTTWEGTDQHLNPWQFDFWNYNGNLMWRFRDPCDNACMGSPYTLNTNVTPNEIDLVINVGCMEESYFGKTAKGLHNVITLLSFLDAAEEFNAESIYLLSNFLTQLRLEVCIGSFNISFPGGIII